MSFKPMRDKIFVRNLDRGEKKTAGGIIITDDTGKAGGIRARWGQVTMVGEDIDYVEVGEWVLIEHGRWTNGLEHPELGEKVWHIENAAILLVSDSDPS